MLPIDKIQDLYINQELSSWEIAKELGINQFCILSAMRRKNIPRRSYSEANRVRFSKKPLSYNKKVKLTSNEKSLHQAALMLYWAEGAKKGKWTVDFTNSDENMVLIFLTALRKIYRVDESRLRASIYCYANQNVSKLHAYWSKLLKIPMSQFIRPYVRQDFNEKKKGKMPYGLAHVRYSDKKLLMQIMAEIDILQRQLISQGGGAAIAPDCRSGVARLPRFES